MGLFFGPLSAAVLLPCTAKVETGLFLQRDLAIFLAFFVENSLHVPAEAFDHELSIDKQAWRRR